MLDFRALLQPVSADAPSGQNLEYGNEYAELERALAGKPERQVGGVVVAAEAPSWKDVTSKAAGLLKTSKDLRVAITITRAELELHGFAGFADGLALIRGLVDQFWDTFHPMVEAEDGGDPTFRVSAMAALTQRDVLQAVRSAPLVVSKSFGPISMRMIEASAAAPKAATPPAKGAPAAPPPPSPATIEAAFQQVSADDIAQSLAALTACLENVVAVADGWAKHLPTAGPDFTELRRLVTQAHQQVKTRMDQRPVAGADGAPAGADGAAAAAVPGVSPLRGEVTSREDVLRAIDSICAYYARYEPSSPVPVLLQRCKRCVTMSFVDILKEMLPESLPNLQKIAGKTDA